MATEVAIEVARTGGNAIDAAIAANAVLTVVYPHMCSLGGDVMALVTTPDSGTVAIDGSGAWARGIDAALAGAPTMPLTGPLTITVPGTLGAWNSIMTFGASRSAAQLLAPAIGLAADGAPVSESLAAALGRFAAVAPDTFPPAMPDGRPLSQGDTFSQPALAASLAEVSDRGLDTFYRGRLAERVVEGLAAVGSPLTRDDFEIHESSVAPPLRRHYRASEVLTAPPRSQGVLLLEIMAAAEALERPVTQPDNAPYLAALYRIVGERRDVLATSPVAEIEEMLRPRQVAAFVAEVRKSTDGSARTSEGSLPETHADTIAIVTADAEGFRVALIQSIFHYFGSRVFDPAVGILYQNRGAYGSTDPSSPARVQGGLRPVHTLAPVMVETGGSISHVCGTMGGTAQPQILAQLLWRLLDDEVSPGEAVESPRWILGGVELGEAPNVVHIEPGLEHVAESLRRDGFAIDELPAHAAEVGHSQAIRIDGDGTMEAGSDPRADGYAAVV